ncbi:MAG: hypothetical protein HY744_21810 [Deltaproteobacteria bacterium]|nr:hypothetical protein [Deltaproteobacteria bacterium]
MKCQNCGAENPLAQASEGQCAYCGATLPHAAAALEKEALMRRLLEDRNGDGVPDGLQALAMLQAEQARQTEAAGKIEADRRQLQLLRLLHGHSLRAARMTARLVRVPLLAVAIGVLVSIPWHLVAVRWQGMDPWLGENARLVCPEICDGCHGPYVIFAWTAYSTPTESSGESTVVYCQRKPGQFAGYSETDFLLGLTANGELELPGATFSLWGFSVLLWIVVSLFPACLLDYLHVLILRAKAPGLERQIREVESRLR